MARNAADGDSVARPGLASSLLGSLKFTSRRARVPRAERREETTLSLVASSTRATTAAVGAFTFGGERTRGRSGSIEASTSEGDGLSTDDTSGGRNTRDDGSLGSGVVEAASTVSEAGSIIHGTNTANASSDGRSVGSAVSNVEHDVRQGLGGAVGVSDGETLTNTTFILLQVNTSPVPALSEGDVVRLDGVAASGREETA